MKWLPFGLVALTLLSLQAFARGEMDAIEQFKKLGGLVRQDDAKTGKPVVAALINEKGTDEALKHVAKFRELEYLSLVESSVTDAGLPHLKDLKKLEDLFLRKTKIAGSGLKVLTTLPSLTN